MKRALIIVAVALLLAAWAVPPAAAQETPSGKTPEQKNGDAGAAKRPDATAAKDDAGAPAANQSAQMPEITEAATRFRDRDIEGAVRKLKKACLKDPDLSPPYVIVGRFFAANNMAAGLRNSLEQATKENPNDPEAYAIFADLAMRDRRITEARLLFDKANSLMATFKSAKRKAALEPQILAGLAMTCAAREDWAGTRKFVEAWLALDPKSVDALQELGQCKLQEKDVQGALEDFVKAYKNAQEKLKADNEKAKPEDRKKDVDLLPPEASVAQFYARTDDDENAINWLKTSINKNPRDLKTRLLAAEYSFGKSRLTEAERQSAAALQIDPNSLDALVIRGMVAFYQRNFKLAEDYFQRALLVKPNNFAAKNNLALALVEQKDEDKKQKALDYADTNVRLFGKSQQASEAYSTYGWVLYKMERYEDADRMLRQAMSGGTFTADTAYYYARLLAKRGQDKEAIKLLENALGTKGPFANREEAQKLLENQKKG
jgi:tetratricopeptide (TPR) repeat protein